MSVLGVLFIGFVVLTFASFGYTTYVLPSPLVYGLLSLCAGVSAAREARAVFLMRKAQR
ncbi:hypothetical protein [Microbacterium sp. 10M-3C3]|jgi:hypothetical protein|uniref:hypothetical protein n=1 Tax=Microbacterium sp. 10M-3C3 TaxID=2483401 RepID=UPI0013DDE32C|nr:hypothetical protein [Microbacterium sp. 10M-3C3]